MSIVKKLHCDHCGRDESIPLNHVWTVVASADLLKVYRGFKEDVEEAAHICSADCLAKYAARWADNPAGVKSQSSLSPGEGCAFSLPRVSPSPPAGGSNEGTQKARNHN